MRTRYLLIIGIILIVCLTSNSSGDESIPAIALQNEHQSLYADFKGDQTTGKAPFQVAFSDMSAGSPGEWLWDFGDGIQDTRQNPSHTYTIPGQYTVSLSITGPSGSDRKTRLGYIRVQTSDTDISLPDPVQNEYSLIRSEIPESLIVSGTPAPTVVPEVSSGTDSHEQIPEEQGDNTTSSIMQDSEPVTPSPTLHPVQAGFTVSSTSGKAPFTVQFTDSSTGDVTQYAWDFGDGNSSSEVSPVHTYIVPGLYSVRLTVQGESGTDTSLRHDLIEVTSEPSVSFTAMPKTGSSPLSVGFVDESSGRITSREWNFGDGTLSNETSPVHLYTNPGTYSVSLKISGPDGSSEKLVSDLISVTESIEPPRASIITDLTEGHAPLEVSFTDSSTGDSTTRTWDFGDGNRGSEAAIRHTFSQPGQYIVSLIVKGPAGEDTAETVITVTSPSQDNPVALFSSDLSEGPAPLSVSFSDKSTGEISGWSWTFGDGSVSSDRNPTHIFQTPGSYPVTLTVRSPSGESNSSYTITVHETTGIISAPVASFTMDVTEGTAPLTIPFMDTSSGEISGWSWDFGDGSVSAEQHPVHTFTSEGTFSVSLTISGPGGENRAESTITVTPAASSPQASFISDVSSGEAPLSITFTDQSSGEISGWSWDFGDGSTSAMQSPVHTYQDPGTYQVRLTVQGPGGVHNTESSVSVRSVDSSGEYSVAISPDRYEGPVPLTISFGVETNEEITDYSWDFGDKNTSTKKSPVHTYDEPGSYPVTLLVKGQNGVKRADTVIFAKSSESTEKTDLKASFALSSAEGRIPFTIAPLDTSTGTISSYLWNFGDGTTSTEPNPRHTYQESGTYPLVLTVSDSSGESSTDPSLILVTQSRIQPWAEATADITNGSAPLTVSFSDSSTGDITEYLWTFGDGSSSAEKNPVHEFVQPGNYDVSLEVTGPGGTGKTEIPITVQSAEPAPVCAFTLSATEGNAPLTIRCTDESTGMITSRVWSFGDQTSTPESDPEHTYDTPGTYVVSLTVTGPGGSDSSGQTITVNPQAEESQADISVSRNEGAIPLRVQFHPELAGQADGFLWDFGDGSTSYDKEPVHVYEIPGQYSVKLTISGSQGVSTIEKENYITARDQAYPPNVTISADHTNGPAPFMVSFTAGSDEPVDTFEWTFGDGETGSGQEISHIYAQPGIYDVAVVATGPGGSGTNRSAELISVHKPVLPLGVSIGATPASGSVPLRVQFTPQIIGEADSFLWDFGDNSTSNEISPEHMYQETGLYPVTLIISDGTENITASLDTPVEVLKPANPPVATLSADTLNGTAPLHVTFTAQVTGSADGYVWDFGDGSSSYETSPTHTYAKSGNYTVKLTLSGPEGISEARLDQPVVVMEGDRIPVTGFLADPIQGTAPLLVTFTDISTGTITSRHWDFGDGTDSYEMNPTHQYRKPGNYTVILETASPAGRSAEKKEGLITVRQPPKPPVARFKADLRSGRSPLTVAFQDMSTGEVDLWSWDLGDGNISTEQNPLNTYNRPGVYTVQETVTGPGGEDSAIRRGYIIVTASAQPPSAAIFAEPTHGPAPLDVRFMDLSEGSISEWNWDFGDGSSSGDKNPTHTYQNSGVYTTRLTVSSSVGESSSEIIIRAEGDEKIARESDDGVMIKEEPELGSVLPVSKPNASFSLSPREGSAPLSVSFKDLSAGKISGWTWTFGDGGVSAKKNPVHVYQHQGVYPVSLTVSGPDGTSSMRLRDAVAVS